MKPKLNTTTNYVAHPGYVAVYFYTTQIARIFSNGHILINAGGWHTQTTKARINDIINSIGWRLYQKDQEWYVTNGEVTKLFHDGMILEPIK